MRLISVLVAAGLIAACQRADQSPAAALPQPARPLQQAPSTAAPKAHAPPHHAAEQLLADDLDTEPELAQVRQSRLDPPHPLAHLSDEELQERVTTSLEALGPMSVGRPSAGALVNGVPMPESPQWVLVDPAHAYGTAETIDFLVAAITRVNERFHGSHPLYIGHISAPRGGHLRPHVSHQAGRDVDISYYYLGDKARWYRYARRDNLDVERTWQFVRALIELSDVELLLIDHSIQRLLRAHAEKIGEDRVWLNSIFKGVPGKERPLIRHVAGHATHIHIRFYNPIAQETARRVHGALIRAGLVRPSTSYVKVTARPGDSLEKLARRYNTSVRAIRSINGLRNNRIYARKTYRIPRRAGVQRGRKLIIPRRRLPPDPFAGAPPHEPEP